MGGFLGFGGSGGKTDRGAQLGARQASWNLWGYGLPEGQKLTSQGETNMQAPETYFRNLLTGGRQFYQQQSAPAVNAAKDQADAQTRQQAAMGTQRTGGTAEANADRVTQTSKQVDDIINQNLVAGKQAGAKGLESISQQQMAASAQMLGMSQQALEDILNESTMGVGARNNAVVQQQWGQVIGSLIGAIPGA